MSSYQSSEKKMNNSIVIGKFTLESLTNGMYASCLDLYREYVQNAADSLDEAIELGLIGEQESLIRISINTQLKRIQIEDNGVGIHASEAGSTLLDIGNSKKIKKSNRGFRGIGRLAGLGYCEKLVFSTSFKGENLCTIVEYDAKMLKSLLHSSNDKNESMYDVLSAVITKRTLKEKESTHYFKVEMLDVDDKSVLLNEKKVKDYLLQNLPLDFDTTFNWGKIIKSKMAYEGYKIPNYNIIVDYNETQLKLMKEYRDTFISDRIKKYEKHVEDIEIPFRKDDKLIALLWYAKTDYSGTILDDLIKGIRIRQGNILIGDKFTSNQYFKEERFNGWLLGELYIIDDGFIPNARRDDFEDNEIYEYLKSLLNEWSTRISRKIRSISYERNTSDEKKQILNETQDIEENSLEFEDVLFIGEDDEINDFIDESEAVANNELFDKFRLLIGSKTGNSKYKALNMCTSVTVEQKQILEHVFDILYKVYSTKKAETITNDIVSNL